jgi:hypothetical protein
LSILRTLGSAASVSMYARTSGRPWPVKGGRTVVAVYDYVVHRVVDLLAREPS